MRAKYEAESAVIGGAAHVNPASRSVGDLAGEASNRSSVTLPASGDSIRFTVAAAQAGTNAVILRYSIPDAPGGGGQTATATLSVNGVSSVKLTLTSRYAWHFGAVNDGTKLVNVPANATAASPIHLFDEIQVVLPAPLNAGDVLQLGQATLPLTLDFLELEATGAAGTMPAGFTSITDPTCGATAFDVRSTNGVFDGADDSSYASVFTSVAGINPYNPTNAQGVQTAGTNEKDYYVNAPSDALQDSAMLPLADRNLAAIQKCVTQFGAAGVWIPPGRFYARGTIVLPDNAKIQGAGMWFSKLVAVDSAPPAAVTNPANGVSGIASVSGNLRFVSPTAGAKGVALSDFAIFGNSTQRDVIDNPAPVSVRGQFTDSTFTRMWFEHVSQGIVMVGASANVTFDGLRSRDTFADGIDFYGTTSSSTIQNSEARGNGDDGFAMWSQGTDSVSTGNTLKNSTAEVQWYGDGLAVYGGTNMTVTGCEASDTLNGAGLKIATEFVPTTLPTTFTMSGIQISSVNLYRAGGNGFGEANASVLVGVMLEQITGISLQGIDILDPTYSGLEFRVSSNVGAVKPATITGVTLQDIQIAGTAACTQVLATVAGSATANDVCVCPSGAATAACAVDDHANGAFTISTQPCTKTSCTTF